MDRRITLVNSLDQTHDWRVDTESNSRIVFATSFKVLRYALEDAIRMFTHDVERVIVDRTATASDFLDILARLPTERGSTVDAQGRGHQIVGAQRKVIDLVCPGIHHGRGCRRLEHDP